jgi:hypothetical protein
MLKKGRYPESQRVLGGTNRRHRRGADLGGTTPADVPNAAAKREGRRIAVTSYTATTFLDPVEKMLFIVHAVASK